MLNRVCLPKVQESTAHLLFGLLSASAQHGIKKVLQVARPLNAHDGIQNAMHYRHGVAGGGGHCGFVG